MTKKYKSEERKERRKYIRIPAKHILECKRFTAEDLISEEVGNHIRSITRNCSAGGVLFETNTRFYIGELLEIEINIPGWEKFKAEFYKGDAISSEKPLIVLATVIRVDTVEPNTRYEIGVCFSAIDKGHEWAILKYINQKIKE